MEKTHKDKNGIIYSIAEMEDTHLYNTIRIICLRIEHLIQQLNINVSYDHLSVAERHIFGIDEIKYNPKDLKENLDEMTEFLMPYLLEANIRNLNITKTIQKAFNRNARVDFILSPIKSIEEGSKDVTF